MNDKTRAPWIAVAVLGLLTASCTAADQYDPGSGDDVPERELDCAVAVDECGAVGDCGECAPRCDECAPDCAADCPVTAEQCEPFMPPPPRATDDLVWPTNFTEGILVGREGELCPDADRVGTVLETDDHGIYQCFWACRRCNPLHGCYGYTISGETGPGALCGFRADIVWHATPGGGNGDCAPYRCDDLGHGYYLDGIRWDCRGGGCEWPDDGGE